MWYEDKQLAIALAVGGGLLGSWLFSSFFWTLVLAAVGAAVGYFLQNSSRVG